MSKPSQKELQPESIEQLHQILNDKIAPVKVMGISRRLVSHWLDEGVITDDRKGDTAHRYFSYMEMFWVAIVIELRCFAYPIKKIKTIKLYLEEEIKLKDTDKKYARLELTVLEMLLDEIPLFLTINNDVQTCICDDLEYEKRIKDINYDTHIVIPLHQILKKYVQDIRFNTIFMEYMNLTPEEDMVLEAIQNKEFENITVIKKDDTIDRIESTQKIIADKRIIDILKEQDYQDIEIKQHNGKITTIKRTVKRKIKSRKKRTEKDDDKNIE